MRDHMKFRASSLKMCLRCAFLWLLAFAVVESDAESIFTERSANTELSKFIMDPGARSIYVAARDKLYKLSLDLAHQDSLNLGPYEDNLDCSFRKDDPCAHRRTVVPFIARSLVLDIVRHELIACATLYYGSCAKFDVKNFRLIKYVYKPVIPNDETKSVVTFIGPGINSDGVLYVGASYSTRGNLNYRNLVAFLSVRNISTLDVARQERNYSSRIDVLPAFRESFNIEFVAGFNYNGYAYFFAMHPDRQATLATYVMRVCEKDERLRSFAEVPLECNAAGVQHSVLRDIVLAPVGSHLSTALGVESDAMFGVFTTDQRNAGDSAVCAYSMKAVEKAFEQAVRSCFNGNGNTGPNFLTEPTKCITTNAVNVLCGENSYNHPVADATPIKSNCTAWLEGIIPTSILVKTATNATVAFIGTTSGRITKLKIQCPGNFSVRYGTISLDLETPRPIKDLMFSPNQSTIYALTNSTVHGVSSYDCPSMKTCTKCIVDPHCGWCITRNGCTTSSLCTASTRWLRDKCPLIMAVSPQYIPVDTYASTKISAILNFLPTGHGEIKCQMKNPLIHAPELSNPDVYDGPTINISCREFKQVPVIQSTKALMNLSLVILVDNLIWANTTITVYNCQQLQSCGNCTSLSSSCKWCVAQHRCIPASVKSCTEGDPSTINNATLCPRVETDQEKMSLASGIGKQLRMVGINMLSTFRNSLKCRFHMDGRYAEVQASYTPSNPAESVTPRTIITCDTVNLVYQGSEPSKLAAVDLIWGNKLALDKPQNFSVEVYKCSHLVSNCGYCLLLDVHYNCIWCTESQHHGHCSYDTQCASNRVTRNDTCPNPLIQRLVPSGGPLGGGTILTIDGVNLGKTANEVAVMLGNQPCPTLKKKKVPTATLR